MIQAQSITKLYGDKRALDGVSFEISPGEVVGLLGLNGAGKSTMLRILSGLTMPSAGSVEVDGHDSVRDSQAARSRIGFLPDRPPLYGEMTVGAFLDFAARIRGMRGGEVRRRVEEVEEQTGLRHVCDELAAHLSHGYQQRLGIAQAIVHRPAFVLLDEPTSGLDPAQVVEMRNLIGSLGSKHTVLLSSHLLPEVSQICTRVLVLHVGKLIAQGRVADLAAQLSAHTVQVRVRGNPERTLDLVRSIAGIVQLDEVARAEDQLELRLTLERDSRAEIARAVVTAGLDLLRLDRVQADLETIFLRLTERSSADA